MFCGIPDPGLVVFLASHDGDAAGVPETETEPEPMQIITIHALTLFCLGVLVLWS